MRGKEEAKFITASLSSTQELLDSVLDALNHCDPLPEIDKLKTDPEELAKEYENFKPKRTLELLVGLAAQENTSPSDFIDEMKRLIAMETKLTGTPGICELQPASLSIEEYLEFRRLDKKYNVRETGTDPDSITPSRLRFMFPHLIGLRADGFFGAYSIMPQMFGAPEFGGLIPSKHSSNFCAADARYAIIVVHLFCLTRETPAAPLQLFHLLLKKMIEGGLLSDRKRCHFLQAEKMITHAGKLTRISQAAFDFVKENHGGFLQEIHVDY